MKCFDSFLCILKVTARKPGVWPTNQVEDQPLKLPAIYDIFKLPRKIFTIEYGFGNPRINKANQVLGFQFGTTSSVAYDSTRPNGVYVKGTLLYSFSHSVCKW